MIDSFEISYRLPMSVHMSRKEFKLIIECTNVSKIMIMKSSNIKIMNCDNSYSRDY